MAYDTDEPRRDNSDDEEQEIDETDYKFQKDAVLFAIDVSSSMLQQPPPSEDRKADTDSAVFAALKCAYQVMQQRIISQPNDMMGVLLFGTEKTKFQDESNGQQRSQTYPNCYLLNDLNVPDAKDVKELKRLVEEGEDPEGILRSSNDPVSISNLIHAAIYLFTTNSPSFGSRRLFIITDNDSPHGDDKEEKSYTAVQAKDLFDIGARIELFPISREDKKFDMTKFYDDIIYKNEEEVEVVETVVKTSKSGDGLTLLKSLISNINSRQPSKRPLFSNLSFEVAPGLTISVKGYVPLKKQEPARTCYVDINGEKPLLARAETAKVERSSGRALQRTEIVKGYTFGRELIEFTREELQGMKRAFGGPVLRIIGFKPRSMLPSWASVTKSTFIYPSEERFVGSTRVFSALWQKLLKDDKIGIAWFVARKNASPLLVVILASKHEDTEDPESGISFPPSGMWLYPLPFADDVRELQPGETVRAPNELIDMMRKVVQNLQLPKAKYNPNKYPNPSLQWHYKILQTLALEEELPEGQEDLTLPKYKQIDKRVGGWLDQVKKDLVGVAGNIREARAIKREAEDDGDARPAKRSKPATSKKLAAPLSNAQLKAAFEQDGLKNIKVAELKDTLASKGLSQTGKKAELLERLEQWVEYNA